MSSCDLQIQLKINYQRFLFQLSKKKKRKKMLEKMRKKDHQLILNEKNPFIFPFSIFFHEIFLNNFLRRRLIFLYVSMNGIHSNGKLQIQPR